MKLKLSTASILAAKQYYRTIPARSPIDHPPERPFSPGAGVALVSSTYLSL
jgi:hypothetical protein